MAHYFSFATLALGQLQLQLQHPTRLCALSFARVFLPLCREGLIEWERGLQGSASVAKEYLPGIAAPNVLYGNHGRFPPNLMVFILGGV